MPGLSHLCPANEETTIKVQSQPAPTPIPTSSPTVGPTAPMSTLILLCQLVFVHPRDSCGACDRVCAAETAEEACRLMIERKQNPVS